MTIDELVSVIPDYAKDLRVNLPNVLRQEELTEQQAWGTAVACAMASRNADVIRTLMSEARQRIPPEALNGAKAAAAVMGMTNVYYRFQHLAGNDRYRTIPARLRMQVIRTHGADPVDFEMWCLAASAVNGCGSCIASHEKALREKGATEEKIAAAVRIASVVHAVSIVIEAEQAIEAAAAA